MMQHAARAHWRAAAWLLERTDPEQYAKRAKNSANPAQFEAGLEFVMEAALAGIPPELHEQVYEYMAAAAEEAFACLFPNYGPWGNAKHPKLPPTPLVQKQFRHRHADPKFQRVIAENDLGRILETVPPQLPAHLQPRALPGGRPPIQQDVASREATPGQSPGLKSFDQPVPQHPKSPPPAPEERRHVARGVSPWTQRQEASEPQRGDVAPAFRESRLREVRSTRPITPRRPNVSRYNHRLLSPKMRDTTKRRPNDSAPSKTPVSREAAAVFDPEAQTRRERAPAVACEVVPKQESNGMAEVRPQGS
ncbi:MAG: hypothetical protein H0T51_07360 [Pirellulales bacterium]|nr:hypothetical protein [Pirellulales bacterium]